MRTLLVCCLLLLGNRVAQAQLSFGPAPTEKSVEPESPSSIQLGEPGTTHWQIGMIIKANRGACRGLRGTIPLPVEWPEQKVRIIEEDITPGIRTTTRELHNGVKQLLVLIPVLPAGQEVKALMTIEIKRSPIEAPESVEEFQLADPRKMDRDLRRYLSSSPGIEVTNREIQRAAAQAIQGRESAWGKVEAIYDWTRSNVEYRKGPFKGALRALRDGHGDCEELSSLFIALCRVNDIPARTVWIPDHCYPEFYLEDSEGNGHWIPCEAAGTRQFGGMDEVRPILQKGDNFRVPEERQPQRYIAEHLVGTGGSPSVEFVRRQVGP